MYIFITSCVNTNLTGDIDENERIESGLLKSWTHYTDQKDSDQYEDGRFISHSGEVYFGNYMPTDLYCHTNLYFDVKLLSSIPGDPGSESLTLDFGIYSISIMMDREHSLMTAADG